MLLGFKTLDRAAGGKLGGLRVRAVFSFLFLTLVLFFERGRVTGVFKAQVCSLARPSWDLMNSAWHVTRKPDAHGWLAGGTPYGTPIWRGCSTSTWHATHHDGPIPKTPACAPGPAPDAHPAPGVKEEEDGR